MRRRAVQAAAIVFALTVVTNAPGQRPNILVVFADTAMPANGGSRLDTTDSHTPNIDRVAREGMVFTDYYAENSIGAARAAFLTGQTPLRSGSPEVAMQSAGKAYLTIAGAIKLLGYATGQYGFDVSADTSLDFMARQVKANRPFFVWVRLSYGDRIDAMDRDAGKLFQTLDDLEIAGNTIVVFTAAGAGTDRSSIRESAFRVPAMVRWPGKIRAGTVSHAILSGLDWFPTLLAAAGDATIKERLLKGWQPPGNPVPLRAHLDGYNQLDYLTGKSYEGARNEFAYFNADGALVAFRYEDWKAVFAEPGAPPVPAVWESPFTSMRIPKLFNLRADPEERSGITSDTWRAKNAYLYGMMIMKASEFLQTFVDYPPRPRAANLRAGQARETTGKAIKASFSKRGSN
jgi:arylsulfatase A-like enzyme